MKRIVILGTCGSGKTTLGRHLSSHIRLSLYDLDEFYWLPGWTPRPQDEFINLIKETVQKKTWVITGNYSKRRDLIWLDPPFHILLYRVLKRSLHQRNHLQWQPPNSPPILLDYIPEWFQKSGIYQGRGPDLAQAKPPSKQLNSKELSDGDGVKAGANLTQIETDF